MSHKKTGYLNLAPHPTVYRWIWANRVIIFSMGIADFVEGEPASKLLQMRAAEFVQGFGIQWPQALVTKKLP